MLGLVGGVAVGYWLPAIAFLSARARHALGVRATVEPMYRGVALTFDDGPHPEGTPAVLELLAREQIHATFFLVGEQVAQRPALAAELLAAGHAVGIHCQRRRNLLRLTPSQVRDDLARA